MLMQAVKHQLQLSHSNLCFRYNTEKTTCQINANSFSQALLNHLVLGMQFASALQYHDNSEYENHMAGKFSGNLIWRIGLQFHLADFNLAFLFLRAMMSYVIVMRCIRNPNAPPSWNVRSRCRSEIWRLSCV